MKLRLRPYSLTFSTPLQTAGGCVQRRAGTHLMLDGAIGDVVTWPGFGSDDDECVERELRRLEGCDVPELDTLESIEAWLDETTSVPEIRAALELALLDRLALIRGVSVASLFSSTPAEMVRLHQLVNDANEAPLHAHAIKIKVGSDTDSEWRRVSAVRDRVGPDTPIRLDANGSWEPSAALDALERYRALDIEFIEQPVPPGDERLLAKLRSESSVRIAADESIRDAQCMTRLLEAQAMDVAVLKPAFVGGIGATQRLAQQAHEKGVEVVITHALGSIVERSGALHAAAALGVRTACGLGHPFASERGSGYTVAGGIAHLPEQSGLGIDRSRLS